jgi:phosphate transport system protein
MLTESITAFSDNNAGVAHSTMHIADDVENELTKALRNLINASSQHTNDVATLFNLFSVLSKIERVSDQAKNICEEAIFAATGATKEEKVYRILFLDQHNNCQSQIAKAIGNKLFPHSGKYFSAGNKSLPTDPLLTSFLDKHGLDSAVDQPSSEVSNLKLADFHVIVSLQGAISDYISDIPFHTATLEWDVGTADQPSHDRFETIYRSITHELRDLMETLRGEGAN